MKISQPREIPDFLVALRNRIGWRQMAKTARDAGISRENLHRMLSRKGNPRLKTLLNLLHFLELEIHIVPKRKK